MCHFKDIGKYEWNNFISELPYGYTCVENSCFLKHLAYASQFFYGWLYFKVLQQGQSSLIFVGDLHDTNLSTFFS